MINEGIDFKRRTKMVEAKNICPKCGADKQNYREMMHEECCPGHVGPRRRALQFFCNGCGAGFRDLKSLFKHLGQPHKTGDEETSY